MCRAVTQRGPGLQAASFLWKGRSLVRASYHGFKGKSGNNALQLLLPKSTFSKTIFS